MQRLSSPANQPSSAKAVALPRINADACTGCGRCVAACPPHVLWLASAHPLGWGGKTAELFNEEGCTGCAKCYTACPFDAIRMEKQR
ncbi:predicted 4Fe-4S ferredoxin, iron-sulfur binding protein [gamma proteobacterium HdN1]|nr:predicted 4Fe-4S ferredoxin, iron-sulfur binding protein [gamma proteobacterium HdN1]